MAIALRSNSAAQGNNVTTLSCTFPTGTTTGDVIVAMVSIQGSITVSTAPTGWTALTGSPFSSGSVSSDAKMYAYYRVMAPGDSTTTATWTYSATTKNSIIMMTYSGVSNTTPVANVASQILNPAGTTITFPSVSILAGQVPLLLGSITGASVSTYSGVPAGYTLERTQLTNAGAQSVVLDAGAAVANGSTGVQTLTSSVSSKNVGVSMVLVSAANTPPTASAGYPQTVYAGAQVTLDASGSSDLDSDALTYAWTQLSGTGTPTLSSATAAQPTFTAPPGPDSLVFQVAVTDTHSATSTATVTITVTAVPYVPKQLSGYVMAPAGTVQAQLIVKVQGANQGEQHLFGDLEILQ